MTDLNPDIADKPIEVRASPVADQAATLSRDILLLVSIIPALIAVLGTRDVVQIVAFIKSTEFAPVLGLVVTTAVLGWRQWLARKKHANEVKMAKSADNTIAIVKKAN